MGKKKLFGVVFILSVLFVGPLVFSSRFVNTLSGNLFSTSPSFLSTPKVFVDPAKNVTDYQDPEYNVTKGSTVVFHVNISDVTDLYSWQINMTWNPSILNVSRIYAGEFLLRAPSPPANKTAAYQLGFVINATDNEKGYTGMAESILGNVPGITGSGRLVTIEFLIKEYGWTELTISLTGNLKTTLLNSTGGTMTFTTAGGWFRNTINGDATGDGAVNILDIGRVNGYWWPIPPYPAGYRPADVNDDGAINILDKGVVNANWGRKVVP